MRHTTPSRRRGHLTYSNVVSSLALFLVIAGGTALAVSVPRNSVTSKSVKDNALKSKDLSDGKAVSGADVVDDSLKGADIADGEVTGADVNESTLGQVPSALTATLGGLGRYGFAGNTQSNPPACDPESEAFVACAVTTVTLTAPARLLVTGTVRASTESDSDHAVGRCRIGTTAGPVGTSLDSAAIDDEGPGTDSWESLPVMAVTDVFPAGTHSFGIDCNQISTGAIEYPQAHVVAVALSAG